MLLSLTLRWLLLLYTEQRSGCTVEVVWWPRKSDIAGSNPATTTRYDNPSPLNGMKDKSEYHWHTVVYSTKCTWPLPKSCVNIFSIERLNRGEGKWTLQIIIFRNYNIVQCFCNTCYRSSAHLPLRASSKNVITNVQLKLWYIFVSHRV